MWLPLKLGDIDEFSKFIGLSLSNTNAGNNSDDLLQAVDTNDNLSASLKAVFHDIVRGPTCANDERSFYCRLSKQ